MKNLILIISLFHTLTYAQKTTYNLVKNNGLYVVKGHTIPFTGTNTMYSEKGYPSKVLNFKEGRLNGEVLEFYDNKKPKVKGHFLDGEKSGTWLVWYKNGRKKREGTFKTNREEGVFTWWYKNGKTEKTGEYINGSTNGLWTWYYKNGKKESEGHLLSGKSVGVWKWWNEHGDLRGAKDFALEAQLNSKETLLVGKWIFKHAVDSNNTIIKSYTKSRASHLPKDLSTSSENKITISIEQSSDLILNEDRTFQKIFNESNRSTGTWSIKEEQIIEYISIYEKGSPDYNMMLSLIHI